MSSHCCDACGCSVSMTATHEWFTIRLRDYKIMIANSSVLKTLAVDLLNPTPQAEARKHKLKVYQPHGIGSRAWTIDTVPRLLSQRLDHSLWTSSAPAVLQSPPSSRTRRQSSSVEAAQQFSVNRTHNPFLLSLLCLGRRGCLFGWFILRYNLDFREISRSTRPIPDIG